MVKRKRKSPKRKRKVVKRKAPKRKGRKGRFGSVLKKVLGFEPDEEMKKALMAPIGEALEAAGKTDDFKTKLEEATSKLGDKKEAVKTAANSIRTALQTDMKEGTTELTGTKEAIKKTGEDGAAAFYKMIDASGIKDSMGSVIDKAKAKITEKAQTIFEQVGQKNPLVKASIPKAKELLQQFMEKITPEYIGKEIHTKYSKTEDTSNKIFFHILSKISFTGFQENTTKLLEEAGGAAKAAATAAVGAAKKAAEESKKKKEAAATKTSFGKRKRGPSASLKRMCKKHGVRLMVKRGKKRVYKSSKVLKEQCQRKLKRKLKKNFGRKKIKRSGIMPPRKRKSRGKKRRKQKGGAAKLAQILKASARRQAKRAGRGARSAASYARRNPGRIAGGLAGAGALGLGAYEGYLAARRGLRTSGADTRFQSPTGRFVRGLRTYPYRDTAREAVDGVRSYDYRGAPGRAYTGARARAANAYTGARTRAGKAYSGFMDLFKRKPAQSENLYGKRRRRRKSKYDFGKKAKKPSAATRRLCKKLKVRLTTKRGGKRVYKSEAMLKKQCKKAMKRKSKK